MALAEGMKNLVNDLKASRRSRHAFVKGNKEMTKALQKENQNFFADIHKQNEDLARQTKDFLKSAREEQKQSFKQTMDTVHADIARVRQAKDAIVQGSRAMMQEFRDDSELAHKYWESLSNDDPIGGEEKAVSGSKKAVEKPEIKQKEANSKKDKEKVEKT